MVAARICVLLHPILIMDIRGGDIRATILLIPTSLLVSSTNFVEISLPTHSPVFEKISLYFQLLRFISQSYRVNDFIWQVWIRKMISSANT